MDKITHKAAKELGLKRYFTGEPCKNGHIAERSVNDRSCLECRRKITRDYGKREREKNPEKNRELCRQNYQNHKEDYKRRAREWEQKNPERFAELQREWRRTEQGKRQSRNWVAQNKDTHAQYRTNWRKKNPDRVAEHVGTRRATKLNATPLWLTREDRIEILAFYKEAKRLQRETGLKHHVDHIIPLQGADVCGLHVPWNLQVLTETKNAAKGNKM